MVDNSEVLGLIEALRAEVEAESVSPDRVGYVLARMVEQLSEYAGAADVSSMVQSLEARCRALESASTSSSTQIAGVNRLVADCIGRVIALEAAVERLGEVYCTEAEYAALVEAGAVDGNVKYFIYES